MPLRERIVLHLQDVASFERYLRAELDSCACAFIVGKSTIDQTFHALKLQSVPDSSSSHQKHRFRNHSETNRYLCAIEFPFTFSDDNVTNLVEFDIQFDVIDEYLFFFIGLPSLLSIRSSLNFSHKFLLTRLPTKYVRVYLSLCDSHIILPLHVQMKRDDREN